MDQKSCEILPAEFHHNGEEIFKNYCDMSVGQLRHFKVSQAIERFNIKKILDLGCSEGQLVQRLSRSEKVQMLAAVDINEKVLNQAKKNLIRQPIQDHIQFDRIKDQIIYLFKGDISKLSEKLKNIYPELISLVEVIEHLDPPLIEKVLFNIFGYLRPPYVFISTPNQDFNIFFNLQIGKFRHWDHKFEWNQTEFREFCQKVKAQYGYDYEIDGAGEHVHDQTHGFCSQIAVFSRKESECPSKMEIEQEQATLMEVFINPCWITNKKKLLLYSIYESLRDENSISWKKGLRFIKKSKIGVSLKKINEKVDKNLIRSIIASSEGQIQMDDKGYGFPSSETNSNSEEDAFLLSEFNQSLGEAVVPSQ